QDTARALSSLGDSVRHDPVRLESIEERLVTIERLKKKYGGAIEAALHHLEKSRTEYDRLRDFESSLDTLQKVEQQNRSEYRAGATKLSEARKRARRSVETAMQREVKGDA